MKEKHYFILLRKVVWKEGWSLMTVAFHQHNYNVLKRYRELNYSYFKQESLAVN